MHLYLTLACAGTVFQNPSRCLNSFHFITLLRALHWIADDVLLRGGRRKFQVVLAGQRGRPESRRKFGENLKHFLPFHFSPVWKEVTAVPLLISIADQYNIATLKDWLFWPKEGKHVVCLTQLTIKFVFLNTKDIAGQSARGSRTYMPISQSLQNALKAPPEVV